MSRQKRVRVAHNAIFGFSFLIESNGGGTGASPKTYAINDPTNQFLLGETSDALPGVFLGWPSDSGDSPDPANRVPPVGRRTYDAAISPNNIRLSQVSLQSITASYGIRSMADNPNLPTSFVWNRSLNGLPGQADDIVGDLNGIKRLRISLMSPRVDFVIPSAEPEAVLLGRILVNGSILLTNSMPSVELDINNLGAVDVVNLSVSSLAGVETAIDAVVGVHAEVNL